MAVTDGQCLLVLDGAPDDVVIDADTRVRLTGIETATVRPEQIDRIIDL